MLRRSLLATIIVMIALVALAGPAAAKFGVVDSTIPADTTAGQPFDVALTFEDHDGGLSEDSQIIVVAQEVASGETLEFAATPQGDKLHWVAEMTLPSEGSWVLTVEERTLEFRQDLQTISVAANAALGITAAQMDSAITEATEGLNMQVSSMALEIEGLQKQVGELSGERDVLQKQITELQNAPAMAAPTAESSSNWWISALVGALSATIVLAAGYLFASRRGLLARPSQREVATAPSGAGD